MISIFIYLLLICFLLLHTIFVKKIESFNGIKFQDKKIAVCVEPRKHRAMSMVLQSFSNHLDPDWHFVLISGTDNKEWMENQALKNISGHSYEVRALPQANLTVREYSDMMLTTKFWKSIDAEHILVFQTDSIVLGVGSTLKPEDLFQYDYVGAPWRDPPLYVKSPQNKKVPLLIGNGGLSLRKRSSTIMATKENEKSKNKFNGNEDVYFSSYFTQNPDKFNIPTIKVASQFSIETMKTSEVPWACHKTWNYIDNIMNKYPIIKKLKDLQ